MYNYLYQKTICFYVFEAEEELVSIYHPEKEDLFIHNTIVAGLRLAKSRSVWGPTAALSGPTAAQRGRKDKQTLRMNILV